MIGQAVTDDRGYFSIDRETSPAYINAYPVRLDFNHPDYLYGCLEDLRLFSREQQADLHVTLGDGNRLKGRVIDPSGHPVPGAIVRAVFGE